MKKIRNYPKYQRYQRRRQKRALRNSRKRNPKSLHALGTSKERASVFEKGFNFERIDAPSNFSFVNDPDTFIDFLSELKMIVFSGKSVIVDLSDIKEITNDALIALQSVIQDKKVPRDVKVFIQQPNDERLSDRLEESGINEEAVGFNRDIAPPSSGRFRQKNSVEADMEKANELIRFATRKLFGRKMRLLDVQRILSECIDNTTFHANPEKKLAEMWWATVYYNSKKGIAHFSILDNGIGIIESLKIKFATELTLLFKYGNNAKLMAAIFKGKVKSRTGKANRGRGLPGIFKARSRHEFTNLVVISNNVFVNFDRKEYKLLKNSFSGTFFYWEVRK
ncbi:MAG: hypothetical protein R2747_13545 [Pyrinomonadaceae bacterium]